MSSASSSSESRESRVSDLGALNLERFRTWADYFTPKVNRQPPFSLPPPPQLSVSHWEQVGIGKGGGGVGSDEPNQTNSEGLLRLERNQFFF